MIGYFPKIYEDELLYSILARYHLYAGNVCLRDTIVDTFDNKNTMPSIEFPCRLNTFADKLSLAYGFDYDYIINKHTLYPYYEPFLPTWRQESIRDKMINGDGKGIKHQIGFIAGSLCGKKGLYFCPKCVIKDFSNNGEAYFHRVHQLQGVFICHDHECLLKPYPVKLIDVSRLTYINFNIENIDLSSEEELNLKLKNEMLKIAENAAFMISKNSIILNQNTIHDLYIKALRKKGFLTVNGGVMQQDLCKAIIDFYGQNILATFESHIEVDNEYNWVKVLTRKQRRVTHPLRHLLFINFLGETVESLFAKANIDERKRKFYPCLNPASGHYRKLVVGKVKVTADYKNREPVGTFECSCGFIYSRKMKDNIYKVGRVKEYGIVWEEKLNYLISTQRFSTSRIAKELRCDYKTVIRYASKIGLKHLINTRMDIEFKCALKVPEQRNPGLLKIYQEVITDHINANLGATYISIRDHFKKEFSYIYRHDKNWFKNNIQGVQAIKDRPFRNIELWKNRDSEIQLELKTIYLNLQDNGTTKITKAMVMRKTGKLAMLEKNLDKLPKCNNFLINLRYKGKLIKRKIKMTQKNNKR